jgi:hypothetical protein
MTHLVKFACIPKQFAPKRKMVNFALPKWRAKMGEFDDVDLHSFVNNIYQAKVFTTRKEFNDAYDMRNTYMLFWDQKPMILSKEDVASFEETHKGEGFDHVKPEALDKLIRRMKTVLEGGEKVIFVY